LLAFMPVALGAVPACAAEPATLLVVRAPSAAMAGMLAEVSVDGAGSAMLEPDGCVGFAAAAGPRQVRYRWRAGALGNPQLETAFAALGVEVPARGRVFLRLLAQTQADVTARGTFNATTTWKLEPVAEREAAAGLRACRMADRPSVR
jgi:hypothetical protein